MDYSDCIFYGMFHCRLYGQFSLSDTYVLIGFMISRFLTATASRVQKARDLMRTSVEWAKFLSFVWKKYYFIRKLSFLINSLSGNAFQISRVIGLLTLLYRKLRC